MLFATFLLGSVGVVAGGISWPLLALSIKHELNPGPPPIAPTTPQDVLDDDPNQARQPTPQEMARAIQARGNRGREPEFPA